MPKSDPVDSPRAATVRRFWRIFRLLAALSAAVAALAVVLVTSGAGEVHASLIIATGLGVFLTMLLGSGLMALMFLSASSGHDAAAGDFHDHKENE